VLGSIGLICLDLKSLQPREDVLSREWLTRQLLSSFVEKLGTLWVPVIQVEVVVNAQWFHGYHISPLPES